MKINLSFPISILCILFVSQMCQAQWTQVGQDIYGIQNEELLGYNAQISDNGQIIAFGAPLLEGNGPFNIGEVRIYKNNDGTWEQMGESLLSDIDQGEFGEFLTMSGDGLTVAAATHSSYAPNHPWQVGVYHYESGSWQQWGDYLVEDTVQNALGWTMKFSRDGRTLALGAAGTGYPNITQGYAKVFTYEDNAWVQKGQTLKGDISGNDFFGGTVSMTRDGNFLAVGAPEYSGTVGKQGQIQVFKFIDGMWVQQGHSIKGAWAYQFVGGNISISDDGQTVATSNWSFYYYHNGIAQVYKLQPDSYWAQVGTDIHGEDNDFLGYTISLSADGNTLATGSHYHSGILGQSGEVRVFRYADSDWQQWGDAIQGDYQLGHFGQFVSLSADGNTLVAAAPYNSLNDINSGLVQVYQFGVTGIDENRKPHSISMFPNPSQGMVTVKLPTLPKTAMLSIIDLTGKKVYSTPILKKQSTMDLSALSNGVYIVHIETKEDIRVGKLILNK